ncbi:alcohol acetyltransferase-domain-containing protein [Hypoxylon rubiginosum]|uniref:Alcohol acetyltransferase-domain-containing protein n=1 Tax=Hypoxylon rubiginosum TaxID=110542 RepID=A0ACB9YMN6_9PEZI|nr:alcohol acetyltransferase-domain-containing protein [Hypoxylon rubiginosum]
MYVLDQYRGTSVSCRFVLPPSLASQDSRLKLVNTVQAAIVNTVLQNPVLQVAILDANSKRPAWIQLENLDLTQHVEWQFLDHSADFEDVSQETTVSQLDATYPELEKRPGWKIFILHQFETDILEILFTWNHPHADGMSGKIFMESLFQNLNTKRNNDIHQDSDNVIRLPQSTPRLPPPIEELTKLPVEPQFALKSFWQEYRPQIFSRSLSQANWAPICLSPYKTQFRVFTIDNATLAKVLAACREHDTTLTGLLHGLILVSLASHLQENAAPAFESITAIDLRRFLSSTTSYPWIQPKRTMGNYVTITGHVFGTDLLKQIRSKIPPKTTDVELPASLLDEVWSTAFAVRKDIQHKLEIGVKNDMVGLMRFVGDWLVQMRDMARRPRPHSWFVSNLGVLDGNPNTNEELSSGKDEAWFIRRAQFAISAETTSAALMISPMTVAGGQLCVGGSWQDCIFDVSLGESVMADLERWLVQIGT